MPFGKHRGVELCDLDDAYLLWLSELKDLRDPLKSEVRAMRERRAAYQPKVNPAMVEELVSAGQRALSKRYHPDAGGSHERMTAVNSAAAWVRQQVRMLND